MLAEAGRVRQHLARLQDSAVATVALGASPTLARVLLPPLFESCQRASAGVRLRAREAFTPELLDWLERGVVDMAIVTNPEPGRALSLHPLLGEPFTLVSAIARFDVPALTFQRCGVRSLISAVLQAKM